MEVKDVEESAQETSAKFIILCSIPFSTPIRKTPRFRSVTETHIPCSRLKMERFWKYNRFKLRLAILFVVALVIDHSSSLCWSLNTEGLALLKFRDGIERDPLGVLSGWNNDDEAADSGPCSWFGVECSDGKVVILNLRDLCLEGTLAPEVGKLTNVKSIILRNNSFHGTIPQEIGDLKELEVLDLGYNNFTGPFTSDLVNNLSLSILLLDNNKFLDNLSPEVNNLKTLSEFQVDENQLTTSHNNDFICNKRSSSWNVIESGYVTERKLLQFSPSGAPVSSISLPPSATSPSTSPASSPSPSTSPVSSPSPLFPIPAETPSLLPENKPALAPSPRSFISYKSKHNTVLICRVVTVNPWATGLSGQLQKAFTTGVPSLQRPELVTACEDFSNIIGSMLDGTVYKGTLSSGVEIAVTSTVITSVKDWTKSLETQFRNKIEMLSKVNHKNFVNLIGYCEEQKPFTRMMVFEYAPNGTLFEHLHIKESEHLDWSMRLRIAMGMAYCLEYLHQLNPPIAHNNLQSSSVYLTEDYAAKISDFSFWDSQKTGPTKPHTPPSSSSLSSSPQTNVYSFGLILYELITVDPTLTWVKQDSVDELFQVVKSCVLLEPNERPSMKEVTSRLKEITDMTPESTIPRSSPLWWAELEILSSTESI
ncbi:unnamed protein product [Lactuca saligna]|uniref:Protein kinase domain-containing protein n=1 Tax=Lactuca saligna TaxID=75948 RepID=A0AA36EBQ5_LACSI|nr:unnamed protein product [Lactuca saligna]